ncbi:MAG: phosphatase PAP2 family protein [Nitrososphaerales archaeon]
MLSARNAIVDIRSGRFVLLIVVFIAISIIVSTGTTNTYDESVVAALAGARNTPTDVMMIVITTSSDLFPIYFSPMIVFSFILIIKKKTRRIGAILLLTLAISTLITTYAKELVERERPISYPFRPDLSFDYKPQQDVISRFASSFPSGHATRSAAFALIVSFMIRNRTIIGIPAGMLMWTYPVLVALSRVYIGVHYPTDVIAGAVLGIIVSNAISRILKLEPERELRM